MSTFERVEKRQANLGRLVCIYPEKTAEELFELSQSENLKTAFDEDITVFLSDLNYYRAACLVRLVNRVGKDQRVRQVYEGAPILYTLLMVSDNLEFRFKKLYADPIAAQPSSMSG